MKQKMIGDVPGNVLGMIADLAHKLQHGKISPEELALFLKRKNPFTQEVTTSIEDWQSFYREVFGQDVDFSELQIPEKQEDFNWLIVVLAGLTPNKLFAKCQERFASWCYTDDLDIIKSVRTADKTYVAWVRDRIEADKENKNKSANDCEKEGITGSTLEERLILELFYHWRTGKHLDIQSVTLCSGSRSPDGDVPLVSFRVDRVSVGCCIPGVADGGLRARSAVS